MTQSQISRFFKKAGLTRKRLKKKSNIFLTDQHKENKRDYARNFLKFLNKEILFLDETGFNLNTCNNYGYAEIGISPVAHVPQSIGQNLSACCVISESGLKHYKLIDGGFNGAKFMDFIFELHCEKILKSDVVLVLDNAPIHKTTDVRNFLLSKGVLVAYLPSYSPDFNPIENFFSAIKSRLHQIKPKAITRTALKENVVNTYN